MRPRDPETGVLAQVPHKRLKNLVLFHEAAVFAMQRDPRSSALPMARKIAMIDKAVDHVIDGDKPPAWVFKTDSDRPGEHFLQDLWVIAVRECRKVKAQRGPDFA